MGAEEEFGDDVHYCSTPSHNKNASLLRPCDLTESRTVMSSGEALRNKLSNGGSKGRSNITHNIELALQCPKCALVFELVRTLGGLGLVLEAGALV